MSHCTLFWGLLIGAAIAFHQDDIKVKSHRMEVIKCNNAYIRNMKMAMVPWNRTTRAWNASFDLLHDVPHKFIFTIEAFKFTSNEYRLFPFRYAFDFCKLGKTEAFGLEDIYQYSNMKCPFFKGYYYINKYRPDETKFPPHLVNGDYKLVVNVSYNTILLFEAHWYGSVKPVREAHWF